MGIRAIEASCTAERTAALEIADELKLKHEEAGDAGADKGYDSGEFFLELEKRSIEPHVPLVKAPRDTEGVAYRKHRAGVEARERMKARVGGDGYWLSQKCRRKIEEMFGWLKGAAGSDRSRVVVGGSCSKPLNRRRRLTT